MSSTHRRRAAALAAAVLAATLGPASAGTTTFTVDPPTLQSLLAAVTPYDLVVGKGGLSETLTLSNPREVRFKDGKVRLRLDVRGAPIPLEEVVEPAISVRWNETKKGWEARIEELPLKVPLVGTIDLADYVRPLTIPSIFSQPAGDDPDRIAIEGRILTLKVLDTMIQVSADLTFRPLPPLAPKPPAPRVSSGR